MNVYIQSVLLGIVEGLTEFLPVSSTAHLRLTEAMMHIPLDDAYWKMYTIVIQAGAIFALLLLYLERIVGFVKSFPQGESGDRTWKNHPISLTLIAFFFTSIIALPLHKVSEKHLGSVAVMAWALLLGGIIMWVIDARSSRYEPNTLHVEEMSLGQAIWIGICQSLSAIFPGTSRSMSTIAAAQTIGLDRPSALEFSFLLSIPTMIAATGWDLLKSIHPSQSALAAGAVPVAEVHMTSQNWIVLGIGFVVSFIVALGVVEWFLAWVRRHGFTIFAIYRIILGLLLLIFGNRLFAHS
ncbi:undecaprenyl-diphosphate phosphatase [Telmatobacter sp. DSM 110680]|uniref:Undecaprenyl-diphosphatase n=1 Tax=Telmatobacter sp. DSM 110680 TaxID=3036704 RepID=A0AAU7DQA5_9BACT